MSTLINSCAILSGSLAAFVYQHSLTEISLPCKLLLPTKGTVHSNTKRRKVHGFVAIKTFLYESWLFIAFLILCSDLTVGTLKITDRQETETQLLAQGAG